jgi:hypothetical protein
VLKVDLLAGSLRLLVALLVLFQTLADGGATFICRHTGERMDACDCPHQPEQVPDSVTLKDERCCQLRATQTPVLPVVVKGAVPPAAKQLPTAWELTETAEPFIQSLYWIYAAARQQAPPSKPIYLSIRSLLL